MKFTVYPLLALSTIVFVGCANLFPSAPVGTEDEAMEESTEEVEEVEEIDEIEETEEVEEIDEIEETEEVEEEEKPTATMQKGKYLAYTEGVIGNGEQSVLFFHASWCPSCAKSDAILSKLYGEGNQERSVYKIDYDTSAELKQKYGVVSQSTFVVIDGEGNAISTHTFPSESALVALVTS